MTSCYNHPIKYIYISYIDEKKKKKIVYFEANHYTMNYVHTNKKREEIPLSQTVI
jgi:hypothetical protein